MPDSSPPTAGPARTLSCIGLLFALGLMLLGLVLLFEGRSQPAAPSVPKPVGSLVVLPPPTLDARGHTGKIQPPQGDTAALVVPSEIDRRPIPARAHDDLRRLMAAVLPAHDYYATAERLGGYTLGPRQPGAEPDVLGDRRTFTTAEGPRQAELVHLTDTVAYWVETGLALDPEAIASAAETVETQYLAALQATFGSPWSPGVDLDPRIHLLHVMGSPDAFEMGYFSDENQYPRSLFVESNEREMVYLNMSRLEVGSDLYLGTLLHELQHLSQWQMDPNEQVWLNEGLSQLAETMAGLDTVDPDAFLARPNTRLDQWHNTPDAVYAHYGNSYLYLLYVWQQAGEAAVRELARHPANGLGAVSAVLDGYLPGMSLADFTADWAVATYLDNLGGAGVWGYDRANLPPLALATRARRLPFNTLARPEQNAMEVIDLDLSGPVQLTFVGDTVTPLVDGPPPGDSRFWFAAADNSSAPTLTAALDLTAVVTPELVFDLWHDLEADWDFAYVTVSTDGGQTWDVLPGRTSVAGQYGPAWNGRSADGADAQNGWVSEAVSLAPYVGRPVLVRVEVLSDFEGPSRGVGLANSRLHSAAGGEDAPVDWQADGFTETGWLLPQLWGVRVIDRTGAGQVLALLPDATGMAQLEVVLGAEGGAVIVLPLTPPSAEPATYWLGVEPAAGHGD